MEQIRALGSRENLDYATIVGAICAFGLVLLAIFLGGQFHSFFDLNSVLIVIGGTIGATLINFPLKDFSRTVSVLRTAFFPDRSSADLRIQKLVELGTRARTEGLLALERVIYQEPDPFLRKCLQLLVDGLPIEDLRRILEIEIYQQEDRHRRGAQLFQSMGAIAPAMGLIGTLIGLVQMLQNLNDPAKIGPSMATALLTTFYGALLAYVLFLPLAGKLRARSMDEISLKELTVEGILCIAKDVNPRILEQRLHSFLPPEARFSRFE